MKNTGIDMWLVAVKENHIDPLWEDLGRGYVTGIGYYVFFLRGDRVERLALGPSGYLIEQSGAYDTFGPAVVARRRWCGSATRSASASTCPTRLARPTGSA